MSLKARYLLSMAGLIPLFYLFVAIRAAVEGDPSHLSSGLAAWVLVFGAVNVVGAALIFRPIHKFLVNPRGVAFPEKWIVSLAATSGIWVFMLVLMSYVLGENPGVSYADWSSSSRWLRISAISMYFAALMYFLISDLSAQLRRDIQTRLGRFIEPAGSGFLWKILLAMVVTGGIPYLMITSAVATMEGEALHREMAVTSVQLVVAIAIVMLFIGRSLNRPIGDLLRAFDKVGAGDLEQHASVTTHDEIGALAMGFNRMMGHIEERNFLRETMGKFVPESVAIEVLQDRGALRPQTREATVLFTDIAGFTAISERLSPKALIDLLNEYFSVVSKPVLMHGGVITQFQGDAMLVTFNVPVEVPEHAKKAVKAALAIVAASENQLFQGETLITRVGVNTGVIVGGIVSGGDRMGYTVHGDEVNLAARLEQMNKETGTRILVSQRTVELAGDVASFTSVGQVKVRGLQKPVAIYTPAIPSVP